MAMLNNQMVSWLYIPIRSSHRDFLLLGPPSIATGHHVLRPDLKGIATCAISSAQETALSHETMTHPSYWLLQVIINWKTNGLVYQLSCYYQYWYINGNKNIITYYL